MVGNVLLVLIGVFLLYFYLIPFIGAFGESFMSGLRLIRDTLATSLMIGYYLSALFAFVGYFGSLKNAVNSVTKRYKMLFYFIFGV